jgi:hypothetical protein
MRTTRRWSTISILQILFVCLNNVKIITKERQHATKSLKWFSWNVVSEKLIIFSWVQNGETGAKNITQSQHKKIFRRKLLYYCVDEPRKYAPLHSDYQWKWQDKFIWFRKMRREKRSEIVIIDKNLFTALQISLPNIIQPEIEFLNINLANYSSLLLHAIHSPFNRRFYRKPYSNLDFNIYTKKSAPWIALCIELKNEDRKSSKKL